MKKVSQNTIRKGVFLLFMILSSFSIKAQICTASFSIINMSSGGCSYFVMWKVFDGSSTGCTTLSSGSANIAAGGTVIVTNPNSGVEDIEIVVTLTGAAAVNVGSGGGGGPWACYGTTVTSDSIPSACGGNGYSVVVTCTDALIN